MPGNARFATTRLWRGLSLNQAALLGQSLGSVVIAFYAMSNASLAVLMAYLIFGVAGLVISRRGGTQVRIYLTVYGLAAVATVALAAVYTAAYGNPYWGGGSDEFYFEQIGIAFAEHYSIWDYNSIRGNLVVVWESTTGYLYLMGLLAKFSQWFGGFHTVVPRLFNAMCLGLVSVLTYHISLRLQLQRRTALAAALFAGLFPYLMWISVQSLRDIFQALLVLTVVYLWLPDHKNGWLYPVPVLFVVSSLLIIPIWEIRKGQAFVLIILIVIAYISNRWSWTPTNLFFLRIPILAVGVLALREFYTVFQDGFELYFMAASQYTEYQAAGGSSESIGLSLVIYETPIFPLGWALRTAYVFVSPLPVSFWPAHNAWLSIGTVIQILCLPFLFFGIKHSLRLPQWRVLILAFVMFFIAMAMFTVTFRHSTYWMVMSIPIAALGWERYRGRHINVLMATGATLILLGMIYLGIKVL